MKIKFFDKNIERVLMHLSKPIRARVLRAIDLLEVFGPDLNMPHSKYISKNLFELRTKGKQEIRIFYTFNKNHAVLLHGFIKKTKKTPIKKLQIAKRRLSSLV